MAVHRFKANESDDGTKASKTVKKAPKVVAAKSTKQAKTSEKDVTKKKKSVGGKKRGFFGKIKDYFVGSWRELRQVRWPNRKQTWALTLAVILFSLFFGIIIFLLDLGFTYLFKEFIF